MMRNGESRKEAMTQKAQILTTKAKTRIGCWNVRTLYETGRMAQVVAEMKRYKLQILGMSEMRWTESGITTSEGIRIYHSGGNRHERGVGIAIEARLAAAVIGWEPVSDRIITMRMQTRHTKTTIIQVYAPTDMATDEEKDSFYEQLQDVMDATPEHDLKVVMGDFNAQIGRDKAGWADVMGTEAAGERNDNGERMLSYCSNSRLKVGGSMFKHKTIHKETWRSPDGKTMHQIDHFCISKRWVSALHDVRVYRGADAASDHHLVVAVLRLKLKKLVGQLEHNAIDVIKLNKKETQQKFQLELKNRFELLREQEQVQGTTEESWEKIKTMITGAARDVLGLRRGTRKEAWIGKDTWRAIDERRELKSRREQAYSRGDGVEDIREEYRKKDKEVKRRCRGDKKAWTEARLEEAEEAAKRGDSKTLYKITKEISGKVAQRIPIRDAMGNTLRTHDEQATRWKEHFDKILNCPEPETMHDFAQDQRSPTLEVDVGDITEKEVEEAVKRLKNGKSAGIDNIQPELLKSGGREMIKTLAHLCNIIWRTGEVPRDWRDGIIIPIPKKGNLGDCNNWRGITLLSIPGKVLASIILKRIQGAVDDNLRQQQAGFRKSRSCCEQIFTLRQIIEKCVAGNTNILVNFIDFKKAFDSIQRPAVWNILAQYGIPAKIIDIIKGMYKESRCAVKMEGKLGEWFQIITGVRQGCILSPLLFLIVIDWVMRRGIDEKSRGIEWRGIERLADLDFADDIALLEDSWKGMRELTGSVEREAGLVGLRINTSKTKVMKVGKWETSENIEVEGDVLEEVEDFCYLGSVIANNGSCDKEIRVRLGKANATFGRLNTVWRDKGLSISTKTRLYRALVLTTLLYGAETWAMTKANLKKLEAAHHRWMRKILGVTWKDKIKNEDIRKRTLMEKLEDILKKTRMRWLGHIHRSNEERIVKQSLNWTSSRWRRKPGRPRKTWHDTIKQDLKDGGMTWEEAEAAAEDRVVWRGCVARCASSAWKD
jgi:Reverse transcriptase (RNA-dependent DNA polymerase)/Endonuclease/Exonuclease/phosphatase family